MTLSQSLEDYLETIFILSKEEDAVRVRDVAARLNVKKPSVVAAVKSLVEKDLVNHERYGALKLTPAGEEVAAEMYRRHHVIYEFLRNILGVQHQTADEDACQIEHHISPETMDRLLKFIEFVKLFPSEEVDPRWLKNFHKFFESGEVEPCQR